MFDDNDCGEAVLSLKQPKHVGFGYVLFLQKEEFEKLPAIPISDFVKKGMVVKKEQPLFYKSEKPYVKLSFIYGDFLTADLVYKFLKTKTMLVFRNWL